jgi:acetate kinase
MNILVFNAGSASLKFEVIQVEPEFTTSDQGQKLISGTVEGIGEEATLAQLKGKQVVHQQPTTAHSYEEATQRALEWLDSQSLEGAVLTQTLDLIGHRVVQGGDRFTASALIDDEVIAGIKALEELAPLHNAPAIAVIQATQTTLGTSIPMVAVFDTVFHRTIPDCAKLYAIPLDLAERHNIRRYGFHGISHQYMTNRYAHITNSSIEAVNIITLHLEGGCSATAIQAGKSIDTSMGFTPLEGLMMGKRCGDIDPAIIGYLARKEGVEVKEVEEWLNKKSGLLGLSGISHDTRILMQHFDDNEQVRLAMEVFCYRIRKYIGAYLAVLNGTAAIVFGGGIGENTLFVRERVCEELKWCGLTLDRDRNQQTIDQAGRISTDESRLHAYVIPVEEGLMIAYEAMRVKQT